MLSHGSLYSTVRTAFPAIADLVREHAAARPQQRALVHGERSVTWAQLNAMADRVAASLQRDGVQPTQSIAICGANSLEYAAVFLGGLRAGVAVAPLPPVRRRRSWRAWWPIAGRGISSSTPPCLRSSAARRISMDALGSPSLRAVAASRTGAKPRPSKSQPDWPFNIIYSSGTTGTPKGIVQPHGMRWMHVRARPMATATPRRGDADRDAAVLQHDAGLLLPDHRATAAPWC